MELNSFCLSFCENSFAQVSAVSRLVSSPSSLNYEFAIQFPRLCVKLNLQSIELYPLFSLILKDWSLCSLCSDENVFPYTESCNCFPFRCLIVEKPLRKFVIKVEKWKVMTKNLFCNEKCWMLNFFLISVIFFIQTDFLLRGSCASDVTFFK